MNAASKVYTGILNSTVESAQRVLTWGGCRRGEGVILPIRLHLAI